MTARPCLQLLLLLLAVLPLPGPVLAMGGNVVLHTHFQPSAPKYFLQGGTVRGICYDIIKELNRRLAPRGIIIAYPDDETAFMPWKRMQMRLNRGVLDLIVGMAKNSRRQQKYTFSNQSLYPVHSVFAVPVDSPFHYREPADLVGKHIITIRGSKTARELSTIAGITFFPTRSPSSAMKMLQAGRGDMIFYHDLGLAYVIMQNHLQGRFRLEKGFGEYAHYIAYNAGVPYEIRHAIDLELVVMKEDGTMQGILNRYR